MLGQQKFVFDKGGIGYKPFFKLNTSEIILLKHLFKMIQTQCVIFVIKIDTLVPIVWLKGKALESNKFGCQKPQRITFKDPKLCGYQKSMLKFLFVGTKEKEE